MTRLGARQAGELRVAETSGDFALEQLMISLKESRSRAKRKGPIYNEQIGNRYFRAGAVGTLGKEPPGQFTQGIPAEMFMRKLAWARTRWKFHLHPAAPA
jgi:hypothetical protein